MSDTLDWKNFSDEYHLTNDKYVQDIPLFERLKDENNYPLIIYPEVLNKQFSQKFRIGSWEIFKDNDNLYLHHFLQLAKKLKIQGDDWNYIVPPINPRNKTMSINEFISAHLKN